MDDFLPEGTGIAGRADESAEVVRRGRVPVPVSPDDCNGALNPVHCFVIACHGEGFIHEFAIAEHIETEHGRIFAETFLHIGCIGVELAGVLEQLFLQRLHGFGFVVDDGDQADVPVAQDQVGNADEPVAADVQLKPVLDGEYVVVVSKSIEGLEILKPLIVIPASQSTRKRREVFLDGFIVLCSIDFGQLKGHELAPGPALQNAVAMGAVGGVGILNLRQLLDVLQLEGLRALIVERLLAERPFHIVRNEVHGAAPLNPAHRSLVFLPPAPADAIPDQLPEPRAEIPDRTGTCC